MYKFTLSRKFYKYQNIKAEDPEAFTRTEKAPKSCSKGNFYTIFHDSLKKDWKILHKGINFKKDLIENNRESS